ncbi:MAG: type II toxin-antitoxin system VapC family toxin [Armatimonadetes bacterium]|nr:type II toxin-antitoxin system VapC family toxin [Armatimonadota bacterium]
MNLRVLLDSSYLIAALDRRDTLHDDATALGQALTDAGAEAIYLDVVVAETLSALARRHHERRQSRQLIALLDQMQQHIPPDHITWISQEVRRLYGRVLNDVRATSGRRNFNDALIILVAEELGIGAIASFDSDFENVPHLMRLASANRVADWAERHR